MVANRFYSFARKRAFGALRMWRYALVGAALMIFWCAQTAAEESIEPVADLYVETDSGACDFCAPEAAQFDTWESLTDDSANYWQQEDLLPFDWVRHFGFRHSSTHGRNVGRGIPLKGTSWLNRPYHVDWFLGPLLGDDLISNRVSQENVVFGGVRLGWDFDYYWGLEWRLGWADTSAQFATPQAEPNEVSYVVSDVDLIYYPWGDSKVRPYFLWGLGVAQVDFLDDQSLNHNATLATMPFGGGVQFHQWPWLVWRLEVLDNLAFGADGLSTMNNVSLTAGMEIRLGAKPASYWPWRSSRKVW